MLKFFLVNSVQLYERFPHANFVSVPNGINGEILTLCIGARVALGRNISIKHNLVNSSVGEVVDIIMEPGKNKIKFVLVQFDAYTGNIWVQTRRAMGIPILPFRTNEIKDERLISYTTIPLSLRLCLNLTSEPRGQAIFLLFSSWSMTGHRTQSLTMNKIAIMLGQHCMPFAGYDYLLLSRTPTLESIMILDESLPDYRFSYTNTRDRKFFERNNMEELRLAELASN